MNQLAYAARDLFPLTPYAHQLRAMQFIVGRGNRYALLMEQGTGKTPVLINDAARRYAEGQVDVLLALAPSGVHSNWVLREIPKHMPRWVQHRAAAWYSGPSKAEKEQLASVMEPDTGNVLRVLAMNWEALTTADGLACAIDFLSSKRRGAFTACDESQRVKSPKAIRTKRLLKHIKPLSDVRAIASGTAILNSPWDAYSQFGYLDTGILKTESYTVFKAEYAELLPPGHGLLRHIAQRTRNAYTPQIVARDLEGRPKWRNLAQLDKLIDPWAFRVLKKDCLDLPDKVYTQRFFRMTRDQAARYALLRDDLRLRLEDGITIKPVARIAALTKLSQVVSGYFIPPGGSSETATRFVPIEDDPKMLSLWDEVEQCLEAGEQVIIWARFHVEIGDICELLRKHEVAHVAYHGGVGRSERSGNIDAFESGRARVLVGQQASGGTGITLVAPHSVAAQMTVIYFSNTFALEDRVQSEDRAHRIGQEKTVRYIDILCAGTIDERIVASLTSKIDLAATVLGDKRRALTMLD